MEPTRGLLGYLKEKCSLPGENVMAWRDQWAQLTDDDKTTLVRWAHEQGDTNVVIKTS